ncbi:hypothetical protein WBG78_30545 [Chryseolinea sp. T2]|uniref:hypothetical protein n=1 Tax=Chryseolinea sp. T2 TaxID=3129255 RepID=UPI003077717B
MLPKIDITNFSGELAALTREEVKKKGMTKPPASKELQRVLTDSTSREKYLLEYEQLLKSTLTNLLPTESIWQVNKKELRPYINDALRRLRVSTGGKNVDEMLAPVLTSGILRYTEDSIFGYLKAKGADFDKVINYGLSIISQQGINVKEIGEEELSRRFGTLSQYVPKDLLTKSLLTSIADGAKQLLKTNPQAIIIDNSADITKRFAKAFGSHLIGAKDAAQRSFNELGKHIEKLADNEVEVNQILNHLSAEIENRTDKIKKLEADIRRIVDDAVPDLRKLGEKQKDHAKLVAQNLIQVTVINSYVKKGVEILDSIDSFKEKASRIFSEEYMRGFGTQLESLKKPTFSGVVTFASDTVNSLDAIAATMEKLGVFKGAARSVGKFVGYAKLAIGIATSLVPPNPIGLIGALGSLGGLFGGGPSIEQQMFEAMQEGFTKLNERLDDIERKVDQLTDLVQKMYKNIMQSLQIISNQLGDIKEQLELSNDMLNYLVYKQYNLIDAFVKSKEDVTDAVGLEFYVSWYKINGMPVLVFGELIALTESIANLSFVIRQDVILTGAGAKFSDVAKLELQAYRNILQLFIELFPNVENEHKIKNMLLLPPQSNEYDTFKKGYNLVNDTTGYNFEAYTENYYNTYFLTKLVEYYITLQIFYILSRDGQMTPYNTIDEIIDSQKYIKGKLSKCKSRLRNLLDAVNASIVQQSILSGATIIPFLSTVLYGSDNKRMELVWNAIKLNETLQKNMATFFINARVEPFVDRQDLSGFSDLFYSVNSERTKLKELNEMLIKYAEGRLTFGFDDENPDHPQLCLFFLKPRSDEKLRLLIPDLTIVLEEQMIYSSSLFALLAVKEQIITSLVDLGFFGNVSEKQSELYKEVFFMQ